MNTLKLALAGTHILTAGAGFGIGYLVLKNHFQAIADEEIESVKKHYAAIHDKGELITEVGQPDGPPAGVSAEQLLAMKKHFEEQGYASTSEDPPEQQVVLSIFDEDVPDELVVLNRLLQERDETLPYVITYAEFMDEDVRHEKHVLTYWEGDGVLMGPDEQPVPDIQGVVGGALSYFGIGSEDPDTVYVRYESNGVDFEVIKDERSYQVVVHNVTEVEQSPMRRDRIDRMPDEE